MTTTDQITAHPRRRRAGFARRGLLAEIAIWNRAWTEWRRLCRLDAAARADMGLDRQACRQITVSQIAARIRSG